MEPSYRFGLIVVGICAAVLAVINIFPDNRPRSVINEPRVTMVATRPRRF